jgi:hypothetical protein
MSRNMLYAICLLLFGLVMAGWHLLLTGISPDFGAGCVVGMLVTMGCLAIIFRSVREL